MNTIQVMACVTAWMCAVTMGCRSVTQQQKALAPLPPAQNAAVSGQHIAPAPSSAIPSPKTVLVPTGNTVTMEMTRVEIQDVLRVFASSTPSAVHIIMAPDVQGQVSFSCKDVPWETALQMMMESNGFQCTRVGEKTFRISKAPNAKKHDVKDERQEK